MDRMKKEASIVGQRRKLVWVEGWGGGNGEGTRGGDDLHTVGERRSVNERERPSSLCQVLATGKENGRVDNSSP